MKVTAARLIQWLQTQPEDAIIEVTTAVRGYGYNGDEVRTVELDEADLEPYTGLVEVIDLRDNPYVNDPADRKVYIRFGNS